MTQGLSLMAYLAMEPVNPVVQRRLFGKPYLLFGNYLVVSWYMYEAGAVLGRAKRDRLVTLERILARGAAARQGETIRFLQGEAEVQLRRFGQKPDNFFEFILWRDLDTHRPFADVDTTRRALDTKVMLEGVEPIIKIWGLEGIGFGSLFPQLTETMYRRGHDISAERWSHARRQGLVLPEQPVAVSFEEGEKHILSRVETYTREYFPELVVALGFRHMTGGQYS